MAHQIERNTTGIREMLFNEIEAFLDGKTEPSRLRVLTNAANALVDTARLDMEHLRITRTMKRRRKVVPMKLGGAGEGGSAPLDEVHA